MLYLLSWRKLKRILGQQIESIRMFTHYNTDSYCNTVNFENIMLSEIMTDTKRKDFTSLFLWCIYSRQILGNRLQFDSVIVTALIYLWVSISRTRYWLCLHNIVNVLHSTKCTLKIINVRWYVHYNYFTNCLK